jgi:hypothetical protein
MFPKPISATYYPNYEEILMSDYTVLQVCSGGGDVHLQPANYGERFDSYSKARKFATNTSFLYGVIRSDRVNEVCRRYKEKNN